MKISVKKEGKTYWNFEFIGRLYLIGKYNQIDFIYR